MSRLELVRIKGVNDSEPEKAMQHVTRRAVLAGSVSAAALPLLSAKAASPPAGEQTPGIYRYRIGTFELTALYDGIWYRPITEKFIRNAPFAEVENALADAFMPADKLATPFTTLIVNTGQKLVLIDTGTGGQIAPSAGVLRANLVAAGIDPKAIDLIVISHFHPDHINGIKDKDNDLVFPNAEIMVPEAEWKFWMDDANLNAAPADLKLTFRNQRRIFSDIAPQRHPLRARRGSRIRHRRRWRRPATPRATRSSRSIPAISRSWSLATPRSIRPCSRAIPIGRRLSTSTARRPSPPARSCSIAPPPTACW